MLRCRRDQVKTLAMDPTADSGESISKPMEPTCWSEVTPMQRIVIFLLGLLLGGGLMASVPPGKAHDDLTGALASPENHPLLLHMTTGDSWRGATGLEFARAMLKVGHPVAVFLNLDAVRLALRTSEQEKKASMPQLPREIIADLIRGGAIVLICQPCLSEFGFKLDDIVPGVQLGAPGYLENFVFADNVRTLTW
jgi:predicted peroxiredoxin